MVRPFIAYLENKPRLIAQKSEVAEIIEVDWEKFRNYAKETEKEIMLRGKKMRTKGFSISEQWVWGASAQMLKNLLSQISPTT